MVCGCLWGPLPGLRASSFRRKQEGAACKFNKQDVKA